MQLSDYEAYPATSIADETDLVKCSLEHAEDHFPEVGKMIEITSRALLSHNLRPR